MKELTGLRKRQTALKGLATILLATRRFNGFSRLTAMRSPEPVASFASSRFQSWPIHEIKSLEGQLQSMGMRVPIRAIDDTFARDPSLSDVRDIDEAVAKDPCLSNAVVRIHDSFGYGTGSFISSQGLIITNHHIAQDALRRASSGGVDFLENGFVAQTFSEEIPDNDYEVLIMRSCLDVSELFADISNELDPRKRAELISERRSDIVRKATEKNESMAFSMHCEVQETDPYGTFLLYVYEKIQDVRLVYAPPLSLASCPNHEADFMLLRAYVAPDGSAAKYSPKNHPFSPDMFLRVSLNGFPPREFVFTMGFPGCTMRYAPSSLLEHLRVVEVPIKVRDLKDKLDLLTSHIKVSKASLKLASAQQRIANQYKHAAAEQDMMSTWTLEEKRRLEEEALSSKPEMKYLLEDLRKVYKMLREISEMTSAHDSFRGSSEGSVLFELCHTLHEGRLEMAKPDAARKNKYRDGRVSQTVRRLLVRLRDMHLPHEADLVRRVSVMISQAPSGLSVHHSSILDQVARALESGLVPSEEEMSHEQLEAIMRGESSIPDNPLFHVIEVLYPVFQRNSDMTDALLAEGRMLAAKLSKVKSEFTSEKLVPDANGCLRLSAGYVEDWRTLGDALASRGEIPTKGSAEFRLVELLRNGSAATSTPVCIQYSTDFAAEGSSGSPVLNADGHFVALHFAANRQFHDEFEWSSVLSHSIGTDVRYICLLLGKFSGGRRLLDELKFV